MDKMEGPLSTRTNTDSQNFCYPKTYVLSLHYTYSKRTNLRGKLNFLQFYIEWER